MTPFISAAAAQKQTGAADLAVAAPVLFDHPLEGFVAVQDSAGVEFVNRKVGA